MRGARDKLAAGDGADQDRHEGSPLHQRIAGGEFADRQLIRQHGVFDRPEQRGNDAEQPERDEQERDRMQEEAAGSERRGEDLGEFQPPRDDRLDEFVGKFAAEAREDEEGKDEDRARDRHQRIAMAFGCAVQQHDDQRILEHIVVER